MGYVRISARGYRLLPRAPFAARQADDGSIEVVVESAGGEARELLAPGPLEATRDSAVGRLEPGPEVTEVRFEIGGVYTIAWLPALDAVSAPEPDEPPFVMFRFGGGALAYVQGPFPPEATPRPEAMVGQGQRVVDQGRAGSAAWIELAYDHDGHRWRQRHYLRPLAGAISIVLSTQSHEDEAAAFHRHTDALVQSIEPYPR